jgi:NAD(P)-dependent dehydrogenase (short-subunit alcohol dehydrogenase family)
MDYSAFDLSGRVAMITGGGRGIGRSISQALARAGADLVLVGRENATLEAARLEIEAEFPVKVHLCAADLGNRGAIEPLAAEALAKAGHIDILVHNAGIPSSGMVDDFEDAMWDRVIAVNLSAAALLTRALSPGMKARGWGRLIFISSVAASRSLPLGHGAYGASKAALHAFARTAAVELGPHGVTANCIAPGVFLTDLVKEEAAKYDVESIMAEVSAVKRVGLTSEIEGPALLLASDAGSFITGHVLYVDGGYSIRA